MAAKNSPAKSATRLTAEQALVEYEVVRSKISIVRGLRVMFAHDLAELYGVETKVLMQAVRRNSDRFPEDFLFQLTNQEFTSLRSQFVTSSLSNYGGQRYNPYAFTEQGVAMLSSVLRSEKAVQVNIAIMRIFVTIRQYALGNKDLKEKIEQLESKYDGQIDDIHQVLNELLSPESSRKEIGFQTDITKSQA